MDGRSDREEQQMAERDAAETVKPVLLHGRQARAGYPLNSLCLSLNEPAGRTAFKVDPEACMERYGLTDEQREAVRRRDWRAMSALGGNIYFLIKLAMVDGVSVQELGARISGTEVTTFDTTICDGGRTLDG
jgi:protocatechuate 4,5-dioxygenase alpha chain